MTELIMTTAMIVIFVCGGVVGFLLGRVMDTRKGKKNLELAHDKRRRVSEQRRKQAIYWSQQGETPKEIAARLDVSPGTVRRYLKN